MNQDISNLQKKLFPFRYSEYGKWGFRKIDSTVVMQPAFNEVRAFSEGIAPVKGPNYKWSVVNTRNDIIIPFIFSELKVGVRSGNSDISGYTPVLSSEMYKYLNEDGFLKDKFRSSRWL